MTDIPSVIHAADVAPEFIRRKKADDVFEYTILQEQTSHVDWWDEAANWPVTQTHQAIYRRLKDSGGDFTLYRCRTRFSDAALWKECDTIVQV